MLPCTANFCKQRNSQLLFCLFYSLSFSLRRLFSSKVNDCPGFLTPHLLLLPLTADLTLYFDQTAPTPPQPTFNDHQLLFPLNFGNWLPSNNICSFLDDDLYTWGPHQSVIRQLIIPRNNVLFKQTLSICPLAPPPRIYFWTMEMLPGWFLLRKYSLWQFHQCKVKKEGPRGYINGLYKLEGWNEQQLQMQVFLLQWSWYVLRQPSCLPLFAKRCMSPVRRGEVQG